MLRMSYSDHFSSVRPLTFSNDFSEASEPISSAEVFCWSIQDTALIFGPRLSYGKTLEEQK